MIGTINGPSPLARASAPRRTARASSSSMGNGPSFAQQLAETEESSFTQATQAVDSVAGLFGLQEVDDATARASRGKARARTILDRLEDIRRGLAFGTLTRGELQRVADAVELERDHVVDPHLEEILDEVDLRARVELAKYEAQGESA